MTEVYKPINKVRIVTATSLFDGHDVSINIMRRILLSSGAEVIHLGHNRPVSDIVECAIQENAHAIAVTSYQGGHLEFFKYIYDSLKKRNADHIKIFGGGGGTILPDEITELHNYGITRIYSPDDGRSMGLQGMINDLLSKIDYPILPPSYTPDLSAIKQKNTHEIASLITYYENDPGKASIHTKDLDAIQGPAPILGITGTGGAGKSSLVDEFIRRFSSQFPDKTIGIICVDPSKRKTGGALLGDRIRMNAIYREGIYVRSIATRQSNLALSATVTDTIRILKAAGFDLIVLETSGIGQSDTEIVEHSDFSLYVMTSEYGAATQLEKIDMLDYADLIAINKFDKKGSEDALRDVKKQLRRNKNLWEASEDDLPVVGTTASQFNDSGMNLLFQRILQGIKEKTGKSFGELPDALKGTNKKAILPAERTFYLLEIAENAKKYKEFVKDQSEVARKLYHLKGIEELSKDGIPESLLDVKKNLESQLHPDCKKLLDQWADVKEIYSRDKFTYKIRDKEINTDLYWESLSKTRIPKIALPKYKDWGDILVWLLTENIPGAFPYTSGVFPFKRKEEDPTRMFAGEGGPERTNKRFHYVSLGQKAHRLSTAFDSVTLYGEDPALRPDIYGKIGNSGVSVASVDDAKKLYSGFNLCHPSTSVSMTINGPAPMVLAFFLNAAIDQQCELYIRNQGLVKEAEEKISKIYSDKNLKPTYNGSLPEGNDGLGLLLLGVSGDQVLPADVYQKIKAETLKSVRGTVQADILKEDQAQNTCIFSIEFALKMMGDIQEYFIWNSVKNFYSVSVSGYHIAEAGANPITQLAFTLANGFTYVEYYLSRGMHIDEFAPNLSFFFSNGLDPEYAVIGRVARRIWAKAIRDIYGGNARSQMLKYHIQTSGRSLHAQEVSFNDIRTTLQALYAIYDNCNSLHTNAYDEAITTPTEESVRRAMAIQLIINQELGVTKNENPMQGAFIIEELTDLVEEAVMAEFRRLSERGGVLGAMEWMYQRSKIQDESLYYESRKHSGSLPIIGVNTFLDPKGSPIVIPDEVIRSTKEEKEWAIDSVRSFQQVHKQESDNALSLLKATASNGGNIFESLMEASKYCTLKQMTYALYEVGGQYRRNI